MKLSQYLSYLQENYFQNRSDAIEFASHISGIAYNKIPLSLSEEIDTLGAEEKLSEINDEKPLAYVINNKNFYGLDIFVDESVLIPRPETEILVDEVIECSKGRDNLKILDICTGSGCILTALLSELSSATGVGLDISEGAIKTAQKNIDTYGLTDRCTLLQGDALRISELNLGTFDIITCNPPYLSETEWLQSGKSLKYEPKNALSAGDDDLLFYKLLMDIAPDLCHKNCVGAFFELGVGQYEKLASLGLIENWNVTCDYQQIERVLSWTNL